MTGNDIFIAILLGGGVGSRLESSVPKAFVQIENKTLIELVSATFASFGKTFDKIVATIPVGWEDNARSITLPFGIEIITGGKERQDSSRIAINYAIEKYADIDLKNIYILVHDIARCFITKDLISNTIDAVKKYNAVTLGTLSTDSLKEVDSSGKITATLDRSKIWNIQTPQAFRADLLLRGHEEALSYATDDAALVEKIADVYIVKGSVANRKITNPEDLYINDK